MRFKKIYLEITNICNKDCSFCSKDDLPKREMSLEEIKKILPDIKKHTEYLYLHVKGEPLLHSEFPIIIDYLDKNNLWINITTNGTLIDKYVSEIANNKHIRQINISIHSFKDDNYIEKILNSIDKIISINSIVNVVLRFWALNKNEFNNYNKVNLDKIINHYSLDKNTVNNIYNSNNIKLKDRLYINKNDLFDWPNLNNDIYPDSFCYGLKTHIGILSDGTVIPCCLDSNACINLGNIFNDSLENILSSERAINIIKGFMDNKTIEPLCKHCNFRLK